MLERTLQIATIGCLLLVCATASGQTRQEKVFGDRARITEEGYWIYNDLFSGIEASTRNGKPMIVTLRCIPCEECVKLDDELIESDPKMRDLLDQFNRVRLVSTNGLDLSLFQYDYDQSYAVMIMNADGTIYARYGTRSDRTEWEGDVSVEGLGKTLEAALALHENYPANRASLAGKQGKEPLFATPNDAPAFEGRFPRNLAFNDNVVKNCIHCHMIGDAEREHFRSRREPIPTETLFQYPHPKSIGVILNPDTTAEIGEVTPDSLAAKAGLESGDEIITIEGQPILSIADFQWVLHHSGEEDQLTVVAKRGNETVDVMLTLPAGWRELDDIGWRVTSWPLRRMTTGGLKVEAADDEIRRDAGVDDDKMALLVTHVGQYGAHAVAKRAGFQKGDVIVSFDGKTDLMRETDLLVYGAQNTRPGEEVDVVIRRNGRTREMSLRMQK